MNHAPSPEYDAHYAAAFQKLREAYFLPEKLTADDVRAELTGG